MLVLRPLRLVLAPLLLLLLLATTVRGVRSLAAGAPPRGVRSRGAGAVIGRGRRRDPDVWSEYGTSVARMRRDELIAGGAKHVGATGGVEDRCVLGSGAPDQERNRSGLKRAEEDVAIDSAATEGSGKVGVPSPLTDATLEGVSHRAPPRREARAVRRHFDWAPTWAMR